jgi:hypothetical protein
MLQAYRTSGISLRTTDVYYPLAECWGQSNQVQWPRKACIGSYNKIVCPLHKIAWGVFIGFSQTSLSLHIFTAVPENRRPCSCNREVRQGLLQAVASKPGHQIIGIFTTNYLLLYTLHSNCKHLSGTTP